MTKKEKTTKEKAKKEAKETKEKTKTETKVKDQKDPKTTAPQKEAKQAKPAKEAKAEKKAVDTELKVEDRSIIVPGEILATGMGYLPSFGTYRSGEHIRAARLGMLKVDGKVLKIIPMSGRYLPKRGDTIVAQVKDILMSGWLLYTNSPYAAVLQIKDATSSFIEKGADLTQYFALGDYIVTKIINVTSQRLVDVTMRGPGLRKLIGGRVIEVNTNKVPRIIGKHGSMVSMIKDATGCKVVVGQNGWVWIEGEPHMENIVIEVVKKIETEGHLAGLTERIKTFLEQKTNKKIEIVIPTEEELREAARKREAYREANREREHHHRDRRRSFGGPRGGQRGQRGGHGGHRFQRRSFDRNRRDDNRKDDRNKDGNKGFRPGSISKR